jgi:hypothetical protein
LSAVLNGMLLLEYQGSMISGLLVGSCHLATSCVYLLCVPTLGRVDP